MLGLSMNIHLVVVALAFGMLMLASRSIEEKCIGDHGNYSQLQIIYN